jgi:glycosyltransferase involved in cell wall biosynthesis
MKLLFIHENLGAMGGAEANILLTAKELQKRNHTVSLAYLSSTGRGEEACRETFSDCFNLTGQNVAEQVERAVEKFEPDLIYLHSMPALDVIESVLQSNVPVVRMVHDHAMYCMRGYKYNPLTRAVCTRATSLYCVFPCLASLARNRNGSLPAKWVSYAAKRKEIRLNQQCARFVVYSQYSKDELIRNGFDARKIEICVPVRCWGTEGQLSSLSDRNLILYVGQIIRGKGVDVLLQSLAKVQGAFECLIVGDGSHRAYCERLCARLGLAERVKFRGFVPHEELKQYYLEASVLAVSSLWPEPFGLVGPEAMRYGLPVVAFDAGGIREWLIDGENGYLAPWMDTQCFAARLQELLGNKELARQMGRRALERVNQQFDSVRQIDRLEELFQSVAEEAPMKGAAVNDGSVLPLNPDLGTSVANLAAGAFPMSATSADELAVTPAMPRL